MKARPTTYNGIEMRSRLEARVAAWFDNIGMSWEYEPMAFGSRAGQYLPDFRLDTMDRPTYLEVKPTFEAMIDAPERMDVIRSSDPNALLACSCPEWMEHQGMFLVRLAGDWSSRFLIRCPCGVFAWGSKSAASIGDDPDDYLIGSVCQRCGDWAYRHRESAVRLPAWAA